MIDRKSLLDPQADVLELEGRLGEMRGLFRCLEGDREYGIERCI